MGVIVLCRLLLAYDTVLYNRMTLMYMVCVFLQRAREHIDLFRARIGASRSSFGEIF